MSLIVTAVIAFFVVEGPWRWVVIAGGLLWEAAEIALYLKWRNVKARTGHEALIGTIGRAVTDCSPTGQAQIRGQIWKVTSESPVAAGSDVQVVATDGLHLRVVPFDRSPTFKGSTVSSDRALSSHEDVVGEI